MFVDHSALTAMLIDEADARHFAGRMQNATVRMTSPMAVARAALGVAGSLGLSIVETGEAVKVFLQLMNIQVLAVPPRAAFLAVEAFETFGTGRHPANLDLDECMTYACARYYRQPVLSKGDVFGKTDIDVV